MRTRLVKSPAPAVRVISCSTNSQKGCRRTEAIHALGMLCTKPGSSVMAARSTCRPRSSGSRFRSDSKSRSAYTPAATRMPCLQGAALDTQRML